MNKDEALKLALEALEKLTGPADLEHPYDALDLGDVAIIAIKEALAQPEQEREACAELVGEYARKWWSIHCASNKHMETARKAHDDFVRCKQ
jgi:hypothetical protein